jgi:hypothetical protein
LAYPQRAATVLGDLLSAATASSHIHLLAKLFSSLLKFYMIRHLNSYSTKLNLAFWYIEMEIKAKIKLSGANAVLMAIALIPDNIKNMETVIMKMSVETRFEASKIGSLIASVDDYLMNANVARDMIELVQNEVGGGIKDGT